MSNEEKTKEQITGDMVVEDVIEKHPKLLDALVDIGFTPLKNPQIRKTIAKHMTIEKACNMHDVALEDCLERLNSELEIEKEKI